MDMQAMLAATGGGKGNKTYADDVFSAYAYTGTGGPRNIINGIDLAGKGGLVWIKGRSAGYGHQLFDTARGATNRLESDADYQSVVTGTLLTTFLSNGFTLGADAAGNGNSDTFASWSFRKAPKFFDIVTYTGNGATSRSIPHSLGQAPGMIIAKTSSIAGSWIVYHRMHNNGTNPHLWYSLLNSTAVQTNPFNVWGGVAPTATEFSVGGSANNDSGKTYVAYLFANDSAADGLIQCGSYTEPSSSSAYTTISLGWEPQFVLVKSVTSASDWHVFDCSREMNPTVSASLRLQSTGVESPIAGGYVVPSATGFDVKGGLYGFGQSVIFMAIRRPNKPPTLGTQVFKPVIHDFVNVTDSQVAFTGAGFAPDLAMSRARNVGFGGGFAFGHRLIGAAYLQSSSTNPEVTTDTTGLRFFIQDGVIVGDGQSAALWNYISTAVYIKYYFKRAPGFLDVVCYTGNAAVRTVPHNLGVVPELIILKSRTGGLLAWMIYHAAHGVTKYLPLNTTGMGAASLFLNNTLPTATSFTVGVQGDINAANLQVVAMLFATLAGISKVFSYIGNGTSQTIPCGFSNGARYVMLKRTDAVGDWFVWDTARGIIAGNDPHSSFNSDAIEVTADDSIDPDPTGFIVNQVTATNINVNAATYVGLAIA
jgi:chitodextrinase